MRRAIADADGWRTYQLTLSTGQWAACRTSMMARPETPPAYIARLAFRACVAELRKMMPKVTIKKRRHYEVIQGDYTEPPKPQAKSLPKFWTPWGPKGAA